MGGQRRFPAAGSPSSSGAEEVSASLTWACAGYWCEVWVDSTLRQVGSRLGGEAAVAIRLAGREVAGRPDHLRRALEAAARPPYDFRETGPIQSPPRPAGHRGGRSLNGGPPDRRRLFGRLAAMFFMGAGMVGLVTLPLPAPGSDTVATAAVYAAALTLGIVAP